MPYRLKPDRPVADEIRRIVRQELRLAIDDLRGAHGITRDAAIMSARRHVKLARAVVRLAGPHLNGAFSPANARLRAVSRLLAPVTDRVAVLETFDRLRSTELAFPWPAPAVVRATLVGFESGVTQRAHLHRALRDARRILKSERKRAQAWRLDGHGFAVIADGLGHTYRRARKAHRIALRLPAPETEHAWRRRAKDYWLQMQLLEYRCDERMVPREHRLQELDGFLGEYQNCALIEDALAAALPDGGDDIASCVEAVKHYRAGLLRQARSSARSLFAERPQVFLARVEHAWRVAHNARLANPAGAPWLRAA